MAEYGFHTNRKSGRALEGPRTVLNEEDTYFAYRWTKDTPPPRRSKAEENGWELIKDPNNPELPLILEHAEAWRWQREIEEPADRMAPTADEMIDVISDALKAEMVEYMDFALWHEDSMRRMYQVAKDKTSRLTRAYW